jgi:4'-phosphopantetheinyl transferase EntD
MPHPPRLDDLKSLLPAQVEVVLSAQAPAAGQRLPDAEMAAIASMRPNRRSEFVHGRTCARAALAALGFPDRAIPVGTSREPVWPNGVVGSISHYGPIAAAVTARREVVSALGIDLESDSPLDAELLAMICRPDERERLNQIDRPLVAAKLLFSAKESIFKCIWPTVRRFVDFQDVGIRVDVDAGAFTPVDWTDNLPAPVMRRIAGRYLLRDGWIMTTACIP